MHLRKMSAALEIMKDAATRQEWERMGKAQHIVVEYLLEHTSEWMAKP